MCAALLITAPLPITPLDIDSILLQTCGIITDLIITIAERITESKSGAATWGKGPPELAKPH